MPPKLFTPWALLTCLLVNTHSVQISRGTEQSFAGAPIFVGGKDVFGRPIRCRTCHVLLNNLNARLLPLLKKVKAREDRRKSGGGAASRRHEYGLYDELIQSHLQAACTMSDIWHTKDIRRHCEYIIDSYEDELAATYISWLKQSTPEDTTFDLNSWSWNWEVCYKVTQSCPEDLAMHDLAEFEDDGSGKAERKYRSEPIPARGKTREGIYLAVAGNFYEFFVENAEVDTLAYVALPSFSGGAFHRAIMPSLIKVQELFDGNPGTRGWVMIGMVDAELNDVPPPYGTDQMHPTLCVYAAGQKNLPKYISDYNNGRLTVHDILYFMMNTCSKRVSEKSREFLSTVPRTTLHHKAWENVEL